MSVRGIDCVELTTRDLGQARAFLKDWGLEEIVATQEHVIFATRNRAQVIAVPCPDDAEPGLREVTWGASSEDELTRSTALAKGTGPVETGVDGSVVLTDPDGVRHRIRLSRIEVMSGAPTPVNAPGVPGRVDRRSPVYTFAAPLSVGHIVLFVNSFAETLAFYQDRLGFILSDSYPGQAAFLRTQVRGVHHNAFILERAGKPGLNHIAFTVNDIHEVMGGGLAMSRKGWPTELGPGRHPISSAYFWYFKSPFGGAVEYYADDDYCTEEWVPGEFARTPEMFAEWAIAGGLDGHTRRQAWGPGGNLNPVSNSESREASK